MKPVFLFLFFLVFEKMFAQTTNLVLNPGFENLKSDKSYPACCYGATSSIFEDALSDWSTFIDCTPDLIDWKPTAKGDCFFPQPHSGEKAVGLITYLPAIDMGRTEDFHEFIQGKLSKPLEKGKEYTFSCYVQLAEAVGERHIRTLYHMVKNLEVIPLAAGSLGVSFSEGKEKYMALEVVFPQLVWYEPIVTRQGEWLQISRTFKAERPYQYFTIGNFTTDNNTATNLPNNEEIQNYNLETKNWQLKKRRVGYYLFDDFWIGAGPPPAPISIAEDLKRDNAYTFKNVNFESGKADLLAGAMPELDGLLDFLKTNPEVKVEIGGQTDNVGNEEANRLLSEKRAKSVANYLIYNGVTSSRVIAKGFGESKPVAKNDTENGRLKNRRVECKIK
ncbi:MAG: OmpA family protein [Saprospiraceae bacterium]|nr:OmpA family protein [Saprospiraceae bacterium]MCF8250785.1 OmpA family protein [Saprospiraceae bacterium]MCF8281763.1 OmpA family protein [Bacteroidales bacterium]MCF8312586.1 OmpA family protein [Saprospiraceae bacterium]MCF8440915.1 OmpA family protein [Saprospiraceae bacterium]